jgi:DNA-binding transcriptional LysR family regulator
MPLRNATLRQLKVFEAVARHLSFSRAAEELHLTQPAVSMQVGALEDLAGLPLFEQVRKKTFLTDAGRELLARTRAVAREIAAAEETLGAMRGMTAGHLTIALVSTAKYLTPPLLAGFLKAHPGVTLKLAVDNREAVVAQLAANEVDFAIMGRPPQGMDMIAEPFARHPHVMIAAPSHPLAGRRRVALARVAAETFIMREPGSGTRGLLERLFAQHALPLNVSMEMASNETIKQAVQAEMGVSFLSLDTVGLELAAGRLALLDVSGLPIVRDWHVVHLTPKRLSPVAAALKAFLLAEGARLLDLQRGTNATLRLRPRRKVSA